MRTIKLIFMTIGLVTLNSCTQKKDVNAMLENSETRTALFNAIAGNHSYLTQFMDNIQDNDHAMQMMQGDQKMMGAMMLSGGMQMMMKDSMMMKNMMGDQPVMQALMDGMMKSPETMGSMMKMMHEKGMMSEDCMESCKKMIEESELDAREQGELELSKSQSHGDHH